MSNEKVQIMTTQQMLAGFRRGINEYKLIRDGDRIAVGLSGGKDSVTLLKLLAEYRKFSPEKFDLAAVTVDLGFGNNDFSALENSAAGWTCPLSLKAPRSAKWCSTSGKNPTPARSAPRCVKAR